MSVTHHVKRGSVLQFDFLPQFFVGIHEGSEFAIGINHERQINFVLGGKLLRIAAQVLRSHFQLIRENIVTKLIAQRLRMRIKIAGQDRRVIRPAMKRQRKIVDHEGNLIRSRGLFHQRRSAAAIGTLQIFEHHNSYTRALRRPQRGIHSRLLRRGGRKNRQYHKQQTRHEKIPGNIFHNSHVRNFKNSKVRLHYSATYRKAAMHRYP